jgi:acyl-lipid omega-6 desaturase (Delta-12 desaturase)
LPEFALVDDGSPRARHRELRAALAPFEHAIAIESAFQLATTLGLFFGICAAMYAALGISYFFTLALALPAAGLLMRLFIIQHDCGHGAYFSSRHANDITGILCSVLTLTPYANWRRHHGCHHGNWNNLDRRDAGADIFSVCLTTKEYEALSFWRRVAYRQMRNPVLIHILLPPLLFAMLYRVPFDTPTGWRAERQSVYWTNALLVVAFTGAGLWLGFGPVAMVQGPIIVVAAILGVWLFAVQHRFNEALWARQRDWDFTTAALRGSSYLRLPRVLNWFTGSIGYHHIHHLAPRVPNYRLRACYDAIPALRAVAPLSLWSAVKSVRLALWDEDRHRLIQFRELRGAAQP